MNPSSEIATAPVSGKPRFAFAVSTVLGTGYLKPAPGTWGSLAGLVIAVISHPYTWFILLGKGIQLGLGADAPLLSGTFGMLVLLVPSIAVWMLLAYLGVHYSSQVAQFAGVKDPQYVVIDEVSGVHLALILGLAPLATPGTFLHASDAGMFALYTGMSLLNWKYLLAAFVLFRIFDIAKPFPCRRLEQLPGGWGIMADDWMAAVYAAICLRLALHFYVL
ncbi:MAG TPA: phosphatidylglycerophosphatase A [Candidatus Acidoferrum sp.]|jgi:phosphatidylglycerophosphatase A|nr:phosphatidylglycerophosphatase A [Candidatus Acidoferrum sp.]